MPSDFHLFMNKPEKEVILSFYQSLTRLDRWTEAILFCFFLLFVGKKQKGFQGFNSKEGENEFFISFDFKYRLDCAGL